MTEYKQEMRGGIPVKFEAGAPEKDEGCGDFESYEAFLKIVEP